MVSDFGGRTPLPFSNVSAPPGCIISAFFGGGGGAAHQFENVGSSKPHTVPKTAITVTWLCAWALSWWNKIPFVNSVSRPIWNNLWYYMLKSWKAEWPIQPQPQRRCIRKETMQLVSEKVEFNACQVSLLWQNSFLVSLWTFQPTLVRPPPPLPKGLAASSPPHTILLLSGCENERQFYFDSMKVIFWNSRMSIKKRILNIDEIDISKQARRHV